MEVETKINRPLPYRVLRVVGMTIWGIVFFTAMSIVGGVLSGFVYWVLHYKF